MDLRPPPDCPSRYVTVTYLKKAVQQWLRLIASHGPEPIGSDMLRFRSALMASFACPLLIEPVRKAIPADVPTLWLRGVSVEAADMLPLLAPRALAVIVRRVCCHWLLLSGVLACRRPAGAGDAP